jgi:hypothetical protein
MRPSRPRIQHSGATRRRAARRQEGIVLVVVMIIIIITTAAAAVSIQNTTAEVRASGREMMMMQSRYAAEAILATTMAWIDAADTDFGEMFLAWQADPPPDMQRNTGGHVINDGTSRHHAARVTAEMQASDEMLVPPVRRASATDPIPDLTGSFGPNQVYEPERYEVDFTDCVQVDQAAGNLLNPPPSGTRPVKFFCVLTARNRLVISGGGTQLRWFNVGGREVVQDRLGMSHDARAVILTPTLFLPM